MLTWFDPLLADMASAEIDLSPRRYGLVAACDGGLLEVTGLSVPVGAKSVLPVPERIDQGGNLGDQRQHAQPKEDPALG